MKARLGLMVAGVAAAIGAFGATVDSWERGIADRYAEKMKGKTWSKAPMLKADVDAAAKQVELAKSARVDFSGFENAGSGTLFSNERGRISYSDYQSKDGSAERFAIWLSAKVQRPLYWKGKGLRQTDRSKTAVESFLKSKILGGANEFRVEGFQSARDFGTMRVCGGMTGNVCSNPYDRGWFFFVDDHPSANWSHSCRYVFVTEDASEFTVFYATEPPRVTFDGKPVELEVVFASTQSVSPKAAPKLDDLRDFLGTLTNDVKTSKFDATRFNALLISGGYNPTQNHSRYWGDLAMMYCTLRYRLGVSPDRITVCCSDGLDPAKDMRVKPWGKGDYLANSPSDFDGDGKPDAVRDSRKATLRDVFASLSAELSENDFLFVFITDHGYQDDDGSVYMIPWVGSGEGDGGDGYVSSEELASWVAPFRCKTAFALEYCYAGGFIEPLLNANARCCVATACGVEPSSAFAVSGTQPMPRSEQLYGYAFCDPWAWRFSAALRGRCSEWSFSPWRNIPDIFVDDDRNGDGCVSFREAAVATEDWILNFAVERDGVRMTFGDQPSYGEASEGVGVSFFAVNSGLPANASSDGANACSLESRVSGETEKNDAGGVRVYGSVFADDDKVR